MVEFSLVVLVCLFNDDLERVGESSEVIGDQIESCLSVKREEPPVNFLSVPWLDSCVPFVFFHDEPVIELLNESISD